MKVFYSDQFVLPLPEGHRFPMAKYSKLRERVAADGICGPGELRTPRAVTDEEILRAHAPGYLECVVSGSLTDKEIRRIVDESYDTAEDLLVRNRTLLDKLSKELIEVETVDAKHLIRLIEEYAVDEIHVDGPSRNGHPDGHRE